MVATTDGFEIAEADMMERGSGDLVGVRQAGGNKYVKQMLMYPETFRLADDVAMFCRQHGYGKKVMELYMEHELLDAKVS
jgi:RecG-like helicase